MKQSFYQLSLTKMSKVFGMCIKVFNEYYFDNPDHVPQHKREGDAGLDVRSMEEYVLQPGEVKKFPLGIGLELPPCHFARIEGRSGNAVKFGIDTIGNIIDENYRGEISAILVNNGKEPFPISRGDRIAQFIVQPYQRVNCTVMTDLSDTNRGEEGFGSSGNE